MSTLIQNPALLDISTLAPLIEKREISPVEVVQACLDRIERLNSRYRVYLSVYPEAALEAARLAESEIAAGAYRGPLHGIPLAVKDLFQVEGMERTCGSRIPVPPGPEATSVTRLKAAGAIILGMLNLHEFAFGPTGINPHHGTARNPWNPERVCGGSSSGSGGAVAGFMTAGALGTDTGGSIRIPSSLCGVVGMKQSYGLASRHGIYPLSGQFDHGGPIARSVRDAALLLEAISGEDPNDPTTLGARRVDALSVLEGGLEGIRIGVPTNFFFDNLHPETEACVKDAIARMETLGAELVEIALPFMDEVAWAWEAIALPEAYHVHEHHLETQAELLAPDVRARLLRALEFTAPDFLKAGRVRRGVREEMAGVMERVHLLAAPSTPIPAVSIEHGTIQVNGKTVDGAQELGRFSRLACFTGQPAISVPCGFTEEGLPVGLQLIGPVFGDALVLRAAHAFEQAAGLAPLRPTMEEG